VLKGFIVSLWLRFIA